MSFEQCTYSPESAVDCLPTSSSDIGQLSLLSGSHTPAESCENEPPKAGSPACMCGKGTLGCSIHPSTPESWTAFMRDSLAKTLALLESRQAYLREPDRVFTAKSCESLAWFDRDSYSWRTFQRSFLTDSEPYSQTWPRWGMTQDGAAYEHPMSVRAICETGGSCWPTPNTGGYRSDGELAMLSKVLTEDQQWHGMTSRAAASKKAKYWPTPTAHNAKETNAPSESDRNTPTLAAQVGGQLNPSWVGWLMGFPIGWASSKDTETPKYRSKQQQHGECLEAAE